MKKRSLFDPIALVAKLVKKGDSLEHFRDSFVMNFSIICSCIPHLFYLVYHCVMGFTLLVVPSILSFFIYGGCIFLSHKGRFSLVSLVMTVEVTAYTLLSVYVFGYHLDFQWFLLVVLVPQFVVFKVSPLRRLFVSVALYLSFLCMVWMAETVTPTYTIPHVFMLRLVNISIVVICILLQLEMGNIIKHATSTIQGKREERFRLEAFMDPLTNLYNRRYAEQYFQNDVLPCSSHKVFCFAMVDIDDFKLVNDGFGHEVGDQVLVALSDLIRRSFRNTDLLTRWGGEEFLIVLEGVNLSEARRILQNFLDNVRGLHIGQKPELPPITISIGLTVFDGDIRRTLAECDRHLYHSKQTGKDRIF